MKLWEYSGKRVRIIDIDGRIHKGFVDFYTSELDEPDGVATISLRPDGTTGFLIDFNSGEIASIECVETPVRELAVAV